MQALAASWTEIPGQNRRQRSCPPARPKFYAFSIHCYREGDEMKKNIFVGLYGAGVLEGYFVGASKATATSKGHRAFVGFAVGRMRYARVCYARPRDLTSAATRHHVVLVHVDLFHPTPRRSSIDVQKIFLWYLLTLSKCSVK